MYHFFTLIVRLNWITLLHNWNLSVTSALYWKLIVLQCLKPHEPLPRTFTHDLLQFKRARQYPSMSGLSEVLHSNAQRVKVKRKKFLSGMRNIKLCGSTKNGNDLRKCNAITQYSDLHTNCVWIGVEVSTGNKMHLTFRCALEKPVKGFSALGLDVAS